MLSEPPAQPSLAGGKPAAAWFNRTNLAAGLGILAIGVLFVALRWQSCDAPLTRDEGEYAYAAQLLGSGLAPYEHSFLQKPPMVVYSYALAGMVAPKLFWAPRLLAWLFVAGATLLLGCIARREFGAGCALPAMWFLTPMALLPGVEQSYANTEIFLLLPLTACFACYALSRGHGGGGAAWFLAGILGGVTLGYKYTALPLLAALFVGWSFEEWRQGTSSRLLVRHWLLCLLGAGLAGAAVLGFFLARDGGRHLWECTVIFNRAYAGSGSFGWQHFGARLRAFWADWWILFLLPLALLVKVQRVARSCGGRPEAARDSLGGRCEPEPPGRGSCDCRGRIWFWVAMFLAAWLATGGSRYGHYYVPVMPFWALLAAVGVRRLAAWVAARLGVSEPWVGRVFVALVVVIVCMPDLRLILPSPQVRARKSFDPAHPFPESRLVARRVAELTSPEDYVYVAGSEPQILYYAQRFSPTRFVIAYPMMIPTPLAQRYQREALRELEHHPPAVIVLATSNTSWLDQTGTPRDLINYLHQLLKEEYERVGGYVLGNQAGRWVEPLPEPEVSNSSLILFRRKPAG